MVNALVGEDVKDLGVGGAEAAAELGKAHALEDEGEGDDEGPAGADGGAGVVGPVKDFATLDPIGPTDLPRLLAKHVAPQEGHYGN